MTIEAGRWYWTNCECRAYVAAHAPAGLDTEFVWVGWIDYGCGDVQASEWTDRGSSTLYDPPGGGSLMAEIQ